MPNVIPNIFMTNLASGALNFTGHLLKAALFTGTFEPGLLKDTDSYSTIEVDTGAVELSNTSYPVGGYDISGADVYTDDSTDIMTFDIDDLDFTAGATDFDPVRFVAIYDDDDANKSLVYIIDLGKDITITANGTLHISIHPDGIITCSNPN